MVMVLVLETMVVQLQVAQTTLTERWLADTAGTGGSGTAITLTSTTGFPTAGGTILVGNELITYTGVAYK